MARDGWPAQADFAWVGVFFCRINERLHPSQEKDRSATRLRANCSRTGGPGRNSGLFVQGVEIWWYERKSPLKSKDASGAGAPLNPVFGMGSSSPTLSKSPATRMNNSRAPFKPSPSRNERSPKGATIVAQHVSAGNTVQIFFPEVPSGTTQTVVYHRINHPHAFCAVLTDSC